jgi:MazG family protein
MAALRHPETGCPWDMEQDFASIAPYTIEESYEVADAIARRDWDDLAGELGDLLFQVVYHARMAEERGLFDFAEVERRISDKMLARHPHVFGEAEIKTAAAQTAHWEELKAKERAASGKSNSALDGVALGLPALTRALKLQNRAARVGFDWTDPLDILDKLEEEIAELRAEIADKGKDSAKARIQDEMGDLLFVLANLARRLELDPEQALRDANAKFLRRFQAMEAMSGGSIKGLSLEEQEKLWQRAKAEEST